MTVSMFEKITDPLAFIESMGKSFGYSRFMGASTEHEGRVLAMACLFENRSPFDYARTHYFFGGKLTMRSDAMLAEFERLGGEYKWIESTNERATIEASINGRKATVTWDKQRASNANLAKKDVYKSYGEAMYRSRAASEAIRMIAPQVNQGVYTPEELAAEVDTVTDIQQQPPAKSAEEIVKRREEIQAAKVPEEQAKAEEVTAPEATKPASESKLDVPSEIEAGLEESPSGIAEPVAYSERDKALDQINYCLGVIGMSRGTYDSLVMKSDKAIQNGWKSLNDVDLESLKDAAAKLQAKADEKQAELAS